MSLNIVAGLMLIVASLIHAWFAINKKLPIGQASKTFCLHGTKLLFLSILLLLAGLIIFWTSSGIAAALIAAGIYFFILPFIAVPIQKSRMPNKPDNTPRDSRYEKVVLSPKTLPGPNSSLLNFPLLYLYFDDFSDIQAADKQGAFDISVQNGYLDSTGFSGILANEDRFLELYKNNLLRIKLNDGTILQRRFEWDYMNRLLYADIAQEEPIPLRREFEESPSNKNMRDLEAFLADGEKQKAIVIRAMKRRYGLVEEE